MSNAKKIVGEQEVINPITGVIVDLSNVDQAIEACGENKQVLADFRDYDMLCRNAVVAKSEGDAKTRRVRGEFLQAKVTMGSVSPVQDILKEAWNSYPQFRDEFMAISQIRLKLREFKKMREMTSEDPAFNQFKQMLEAAYDNGTIGSPSVAVEGSHI